MSRLGTMIITTVALLVLPTPALAVSIVGDPYLTGWAAVQVAQSSAPAPTVDVVTIALDRDLSVGGYGANGTWMAGRLTMSARNEVALMHELGHAFDDYDLEPPERAWLLPRLGYHAGVPWWVSGRWSGPDPMCVRGGCPNERFADVYAGCANNYRLGTFRYGPLRPTSDRGRIWWGDMTNWSLRASTYRAICRALWNFAGITRTGA